MHGFRVEAVKKSHVVFACTTDADFKRIEQLELEYANGEFAKFDSMVVDLKSLPLIEPNTIDPRMQVVDNLGQAAYLQISRLSVSQWSAIGKKPATQWSADGRNGGGVVFDVNPADLEAFEAKRAAWTNSRLRDFNQEIRTIMALKKRGT